MKKSLLITIVFASALAQASTPPFANWPANKTLNSTNSNTLSRSALSNTSFRFSEDGNSPEQRFDSPLATAQATAANRPVAHRTNAETNTEAPLYTLANAAIVLSRLARFESEEQTARQDILKEELASVPAAPSEGTIAPCNTPDNKISDLDLEMLRIHTRLSVEEKNTRKALITRLTTPVYVGDGIYVSPLSSLPRPNPVRFTAGTPIKSPTGMMITPMHRKS